jgi:8-oxo-dGTP pyrophosphatase MutT (NUDIX family)
MILMRKRAGIILIENKKLALIERHRANLHYFTFPGGGLDEGETPYQAAIREADEELGIQVEIRQLTAEVSFNGNIQYYFLAEKLSGQFGTGTGEEYREYNPIYGTYLPLWMPLEDVVNNNVVPSELAKLVWQFSQEGWPTTPVTIIEIKK